MTEEEAKTKWCPQARVGNSGVAGYTMNRSVTDSAHTMEHSLCIASACMAWRVGKPDYLGLPKGHPGLPTGFCGLAGAPQ